MTALALATAAPASAASDKNDCKKGGWQTLTRSEDNSGFKNQGQCVAYASNGGTFAQDVEVGQAQ